VFFPFFALFLTIVRGPQRHPPNLSMTAALVTLFGARRRRFLQILLPGKRLGRLYTKAAEMHSFFSPGGSYLRVHEKNSPAAPDSYAP
jgi:hypothetical protein